MHHEQDHEAGSSSYMTSRHSNNHSYKMSGAGCLHHRAELFGAPAATRRPTACMSTALATVVKQREQAK